MFQQALLKHIKEELPENTSLNDAIATVLEISYDAAHRRTSLKSKFSLEESVVLATHFKISLDSLFSITNKQFVTVEKTNQITNELALQKYFVDSYNSLLPLLTQKESRIFYSAKDIPLFYTLKGGRFTDFKIYVWLKLSDKNFKQKSFDNFHPQLSTLQAAKKLGSLYQDLPISEIWDITSVNSMLKQLHFYYLAGQISSETSLELCDLLKEMIVEISKKVTPENDRYRFYYDELLLMNNNVLVTTSQMQSLYVQFSLLSYYLTNDKQTCYQAKEYFEKQLQNSKLLNTSGEKERNTFFNRMLQKVDALYKLIEARTVLDFE